MQRSRFVWLAIASVTVAAAAAHAARPQYGGTLRVEIRATIRSLDPSAAPADRGEAMAARRLASLIFDTLVDVDPAGGLRPALALSWEAESGAARWRFHLRPGVALHDNTVLEPWQVATALRAASSAWSVSTDGEFVVIEASRPRPDLPWELADPRYAIVVRRTPAGLSGTGPFRLDRVEPGRIALRAHDGAWSGRPFVDAIQIEMGRAAAAQLTDLESGRADVVEVQPPDARRLRERGLTVATTHPVHVFALVFEPHRVDAANDPYRRAIAGTLDRPAIASVLLQGRGEAAVALLPPWASGYPAGLVAPQVARTPRASATRLPHEQQALTLRVDPSDPIARTIADRIAVDAREAGFAVTVQTPAGLAPRPDARLVKLTVDPTTPDRALGGLIADLGNRTVALATAEQAPAAGANLDAVVAFERSLLQGSVVVPVVRVPELYGLGDAVDVFSADAVTRTGRWNFANVWVRNGATPRRH